jgi:hypothetical protein
MSPPSRKEHPLERSLTVLLPVHNAQSTLSATIPAILDVVSELTPQFELVIIDDGSTDATSEVAEELTHCYPQVRFLSHGSPVGCEAAIRAGLQQSRGEIVFVRHEGAGPNAEEIRRLWRAADAHPSGRPPASDWPASATSECDAATDRFRGTRLSSTHAGHRPGYQQIHRPAAQPARGRSKPGRPNFLAKVRQLAWGE